MSLGPVATDRSSAIKSVGFGLMKTFFPGKIRASSLAPRRPSKSIMLLCFAFNSSIYTFISTILFSSSPKIKRLSARYGRGCPAEIDIP